MKLKTLIIFILGLFFIFAANSCKKDKMLLPKTNGFYKKINPNDNLDHINPNKTWQINDDEDEPLDRL